MIFGVELEMRKQKSPGEKMPSGFEVVKKESQRNEILGRKVEKIEILQKVSEISSSTLNYEL